MPPEITEDDETPQNDPVPRWAELGLPLPRLQLTWEKIDPPEDGYNWLCKYEIIIPIPKNDIRNDGKDGKVGGGKGYLTASIGGTRRGGEVPPDKWGKLDTPFRDGSHIQWDSLNLGMPAFVVYGDKYRRLDGPSRQWPPLESDRE